MKAIKYFMMVGSICNLTKSEGMLLVSVNHDLYPPTLRQNFGLMGATYGRGLNQNSGRNTGAEFGGTDRIRH